MAVSRKQYGPYYRPRLRILIDPVYVQIANLTSSSTYHKYVTLVRELARRGHFVYWCVPDVEYVPSEVENLPNVAIIRTSYIQDQFIVDGLITDQFFNYFNRTSGQYHVDMVLTSRTSLALLYKRLLESPRFHDTDRNYTDKSYGLPVAVIEEFPQTRERQHVSGSYWQMQCQGYVGSDMTVFLSAHNREECTKELAEIFNNSVVEKFVKKSRLIPAGIECAELDKYQKPGRWKHEQGFNVITVGRIFGESYIEFLPWFDYLYRSGRSDFTLSIAMSGAFSGPMRAKLEKIGFDFRNNFGRQFRVYENNPRKNFLAMLPKYHCFIAPVSHLDHPTGIFEALYLGVPGILPISDYQQTFFKDYPFVINPGDKAALLATLLWIKDHPQEARDMIAPWRGIIREKYDAPTNIKLLCDEIEKVAHDPIDRFRTSEGVIDLLRDLKGATYTWHDIVAYLKKAGRMGVSIGDLSIRQTLTYARGAIHHAMGVVGYVDDCTTPVERFVRRDVFDQRYPKVADAPHTCATPKTIARKPIKKVIK